jgi:hypothetical protein
MLKLRIYFVIVGLIACAACKKLIGPEQPSLGSITESKIAYLGGSWLCGVQNNVWTPVNQGHSPATFLNGQLIEAGALATLSQPKLLEGVGFGLGNVYHPAVGAASIQLKKFDCDPQATLFFKEINETATRNFQAVWNKQNHPGDYTDFSFPNATMEAIFSNDPSYSASLKNPFYHYFASKLGSSNAVSDLVKTKATCAVLSIGMDDIYNWAKQGGGKDATPIPSTAVFEAKLDNLLSQLQANGMKSGVLCTIPATGTIPYYTTLPATGVQLDSVKASQLNALYGNSNLLHFVKGANGFIAESSFGSLVSGYSKKIKLLTKDESILLSINADSLKCNGMGVFFPIADEYVLDVYELGLINTAVLNYNQIIKQKAIQYHLAVADWYALMENVKIGTKINGVPFSSAFIKGNFFSADGQNPSTQGYALLTNEIIRALNEKYFSTLAPIDPFAYPGLVLP